MWRQQTPAELNRLVDELSAVQRPRAAFVTVEMDFAEIEPRRLLQLLRDMATASTEPAGHYMPHGHHIADAFKVLTKSAEIPRGELARLEFMYIDALDHTSHGIKNLEEELTETPELFAQALGLVFRRKDGGEDPTEWRSANPENTQAVATSAYKLLSHTKRLPGTEADGNTINTDKLRAWLTKARDLARQYGRAQVGDIVIGELFGRSKLGRDGRWPCEELREVLEEFGTDDIARGMRTGRFNSRGAGFRGEGGAQERELAGQYRAWSDAMVGEFPFAARVLDLMAQGYERDADREDTEMNVRRRLRN